MLTRCRKVALIWRSTGTRPASTFSASHTADFERPTPIVLVTTEGHKHDMWLGFMKFASNHGYSGMCVTANMLTSFEAAADQLHKEIVSAKLTPPVMIADEMSTFAAQKYLESYALSGLVLVNPFPPNNARLTLNHWQTQQPVNGNVAVTADKYGWSKEQCDVLQHKIQSILSNSAPDDDRVNLERGCVPALIVTTDDSRRWLSPAQLDELIHLHAVPPEDVHHFTKDHGDERSNILVLDHAEEFNTTVITWIENNT